MKRKKIEFSKLVITLLVSTYFVGLILGMFIAIRLIIVDTTNSVSALVALLSYIGGTNAISIPFYLRKSEHENIHKNPDIQTIEQYNQMNNFDTNLDESDINK